MDPSLKKLKAIFLRKVRFNPRGPSKAEWAPGVRETVEMLTAWTTAEMVNA